MNWLEQIDILVSNWLFIDPLNDPSRWLLLIAGSASVYLIPLILLVEFFYRRHRLSALKATVIGLVAWLLVSIPIGEYLYSQFGWRERPFFALGLQEWLLETPAKAFPSDHSALLMAITLVYFSSVHRRLAGWLLALTLVAGLGRVMLGFHFVGDVLGGYLIAASVFGLSRLVNRPLDRLLAWGLKISRFGDG